MSARAQRRPARFDFPMVGVLRKQGRFLAAEPLFGRDGAKVALDDRRGSVGDLVLVGAGKRGARVLRPLGKPWVARDVLEGLMLDRGLRRSFPRKAEAEAAEVAPAGDEASRVDLRDLATFTIDPDDAKDFDDAISAEQHDGFVRMWVHIADVSAYVRPGGAIDKEAERRATSVYVPGAVEPMLPEALSNRACSLRPGEDKLAVTVEMDIARNRRAPSELSSLADPLQRPADVRAGRRGVRRARPRRGRLGRAARCGPRRERCPARASRATRLARGQLARARLRVGRRTAMSRA